MTIAASWSLRRGALLLGLMATFCFFPVYGQSWTGTNARSAEETELKLRNPYEKQLFYLDTKNLIIEVLGPPALGVDSPKLEAVLMPASKDGALGEPVEREQVDPIIKDGKLVAWNVNFGLQPDGVYAVAFRAINPDGIELASRAPEPLVVLKDLQQKQIAGTEYTEGLDLELEDTIDFTDPDDPHPWIEGQVIQRGDPVLPVEEPRIIEKDGLKYREITDDSRGSMMSYRFEFKHPGDFYMLELEYPDDAKRSMTVSISTKLPKVWTNSQTGTGIECGGKFYNTGDMKKLRWIHVADPGVHSIDMINIWPGWPGAAARFSIYHIKDGLPAVKSGTGRDYGVYSERCFYRSGFGQGFGILQPTPEGDDLQKDLHRLSWLKDTCERYVQYLNFCGQNLHHMGCVQYTLRNTPFVPINPESDSAYVVVCPRTMLAHTLKASGLRFLSGVQFSNPPVPEAATPRGKDGERTTVVTDEEVAAGKPTFWRVDAQGKQRGGLYTWPGNWQHPLFQRELLKVMQDLENTFGPLGNWRGVTSGLGVVGHPESYFYPAYNRGTRVWDPGPLPYENPLEYSYDDITFRKFAEDTGVELGIDPLDPERFAKRAAAVAEEPLRGQFLEWRGRSLVDFLTTAANIIARNRSDVFFINLPFNERPGAFLAEFGKPYTQMMHEFGLPVKALGSVANMAFMHWTVSWRWRLPHCSQNPYFWFMKERDIVLDAFEGLPRRMVLVRSSWDENFFASPGFPWEKPAQRADENQVIESDWIFGQTRIRGHVQPSGYHAREGLIQAIVTADPQLLLTGFTDLSMMLGNEQILREALVPFTHMPPDRFDEVLDTDLETNLVIRKLSKGDESWFYVVNPGFWPVEGVINLSAGGAIMAVPSGEQVSDGGDIAMEVNLDPFGLLAYKVDSGNLAIESYTTRALGDREKAHLMNLLDMAAEGGELRARDPEVEEFTDFARVRREPTEAQLQMVEDAREALERGDYALAWSMIKDHRIWPVDKWHLMTEEERRSWPPRPIWGARGEPAREAE